jgi:hypothetical protein
MSATRILIAQHRTIEAVFEDLACETRLPARARLASRLTEELIAHMTGEETIFYPAAREALGPDLRLDDGPADDHFMLRAQLRRLLATSVHEPAFQPRFEALRLLFARHTEVEETDLFPRVEAALAVGELEALGIEVQGSRPPIWLVTTEAHALIRSNAGNLRGVRLPAVR